MHGQELLRVLLLVLAVAVVAGAARRLNWSAPILLVVFGLAVSPIPGLPSYQLDPEVVLVLFLPPILYSAAISSSLRDVKENARPILLLSVGLVVFTTAAVALVALAVVPTITVAAAFALGAIVAPPDAVAATAVARRLGLPSRAVTILEGESLFNDATALVLYGVAVDVVVRGDVPAGEIAWRFALSILGGAGAGFAVAFIISAIRSKISDPLLENTISLLTPFAAYLPAEYIGASGVLSVVVAGLWLGHRAPRVMSSAARLQEHAIWSLVDFVLTGVVFALIGLQLPDILTNLHGHAVTEIVVAAVAVSLAAVIARIAWVFPATYLPRLSRRLQARDPAPPWQLTFVLSWAGMRGVVSLAAAIALPVRTDAGAAFPARELILLLTLVVILVTLVGQGFSLPFIIRRSGVRVDETARMLSEASAQQAASDAAAARLQVLLDEGEVPPGVAEQLNEKLENRRNAAWERLGGGGGGTLGSETPTAAYRRLRREMLLAERVELVRLRDRGDVRDDVLRGLLRELDLEDALLSRE